MFPYMPRLPRLDVSELVHHVIVREIKRGRLFRDDDDRRNFSQCFHALLVETDTICCAWVFPQSGPSPVAPTPCCPLGFMQRLLTG
jgi:putative transposase